jgi:hypothetical protein
MAAKGRRNLAWFAAVAFVVLFGAGEFIGWVRAAWTADGWWGIDLHLVLDAGSRLERSLPLYADPRFLYPPLAAVIGRALAGLDFDLLSLGLTALKVALTGACVLALTPGWERRHRALAFVGVSCSLPYLHDVMLGNVNVFLVGAMVPAVLARPRARHGVLLGILAAVFAKPLLLPVLLWLLVWRPKVFAATVGSATAATALSLVLVGPGAYGDWLSALRAGERFASAFAGNHGVSALAPDLWVPIAAVTGIALLVVLARRGPIVGLTWAVTAGLLIAPYAGTYAALPITIAILPLASVAPWLAFAVVAVSPIATTIPLPIYAGAILVASLAARERRAGLIPWRLRAFTWPERGPDPDIADRTDHGLGGRWSTR